jgi:NAD(P)-dependent dehydrogenase (short-subunit alcohol dehydrogenase family)
VDADGLEAAAAEIRAAGGKVGHVGAADVSDHDAVVALADAVHTAHGSVDIVMNVAGISTWGAIEQLEHRHWRRTIDVNLVGPISVLECFVPPMIEAGRGGHVVNVSSAAGLFGLPWHAPYSASKFGLRGVSEVLRFDLRRHGIGVSLVCPGAVKTPLVGTVDIVGVDRGDPKIKALVERFERHAVTPEHVADKILEGIERNRYMVFTSADIRVGYWFQRKFALPYELAMRALNDRLVAAARKR